MPEKKKAAPVLTPMEEGQLDDEEDLPEPMEEDEPEEDSASEPEKPTKGNAESRKSSSKKRSGRTRKEPPDPQLTQWLVAIYTAIFDTAANADAYMDKITPGNEWIARYIEFNDKFAKLQKSAPEPVKTFLTACNDAIRCTKGRPRARIECQASGQTVTGRSATTVDFVYANADPEKFCVFEDFAAALENIHHGKFLIDLIIAHVDHLAETHPFVIKDKPAHNIATLRYGEDEAFHNCMANYAEAILNNAETSLAELEAQLVV